MLSEFYQEDIFLPMAAAVQPSLTAHEWLSRMNREPIMTSLRPGSELLDSRPLPPEKKLLSNSMVQVSSGPLEP
ncbi:hypothetical protein U0070_013148 [Myodes glareolus]|uniref:Uncharacterized protein n=1 Tax=Myodes glareolus TaxID=447135 RepID=A0AAW0HK96_MYOGA